MDVEQRLDAEQGDQNDVAVKKRVYVSPAMTISAADATRGGYDPTLPEATFTFAKGS